MSIKLNSDAMGKPIERQVVSGACYKCGYAGHLPFQCRNNMPIEVNGVIHKPLLSSSSSESEFETPLQREGNYLLIKMFIAKFYYKTIINSIYFRS